MRGSRTAHVRLLYVIHFVGTLSTALLIPVLPRIAKAIDVPFSQTTWILTVMSITAALTIPVMGFLSDIFTRTVVLVPGLFLYGLGGLIAGVAPFLAEQPFSLLLIGRAVQGIGSAGTSVQTLALAADILEPKKRAHVLSVLETANAAGKASGPLIGSALALISWYAPFFFFPLAAIPLAIILWLFLGTLPDMQEKRISLMRYQRSFWQAVKPKLVPMTLTFIAGFVSLSLILLLMTLLSRELAEAGIKGVARGALIMAPETLVAIAAFFTAKYLQSKLEQRSLRITLVGIGLMAVCLAGASFDFSLWLFVFFVNVAGLGAGTILATMNTLVANSVNEDERGFVTSIYGAFRSLGAMSLPIFFGLRHLLGSETAVFWVLSGTLLALGIFTFYFLDTKRLLQSATQ